MARRVLALIPVLFLFSVSSISAQLNEYPGGGAPFTGDSVRLDFQGLPPDMEVGRLLAKWGITFEVGDSGNPQIVQFVALGSTKNVVRNVPPAGTSANKPLVLNFRYPVNRVGVVLGNGAAGTQVRMEAFNRFGASLGVVQRNGLPEPELIEFDTAHVNGISKLTIGYGADQNAEQLESLQIDYLERPSFVTFLAQVGNGAIPGVGSLQTTLVVSNLSNSTAVGELRFFGSNGAPLAFQIEGVSANQFPLNIPPFSSKSLTTAGAALGVGYARIEASVPVEGTAVFRIVAPTGAVLTEAGVGSNPGAALSVGAVQKTVQGSFDSGIAIVNTTNRQASAWVELYNQLGQRVATNGEIAALGPGEHAAQFLADMFPAFANQDFDGTVRITSDVPLAVAILRTAVGQVLSSLPVGSTEE